MVTSPVVFNVDVVSIEPDVLMLVAPVITEAPSIVPVVISALVKVLLARVSAASRVTMTPLVGKVAVELMPVPPLVLGNKPATAEGELKFRLPNCGLLPAPTVNT